MKFGLKKFRGVLKRTPDITRRESTIGISFVEGAGAKVTVVAETDKAISKIAKLKEKLNQLVAEAMSQLYSIRVKAAEIVAKVEEAKNTKTLGIRTARSQKIAAVQNKALRKIAQVNVSTENRVEKLYKAMNKCIEAKEAKMAGCRQALETATREAVELKEIKKLVA